MVAMMAGVGCQSSNDHPRTRVPKEEVAGGVRGAQEQSHWAKPLAGFL